MKAWHRGLGLAVAIGLLACGGGEGDGSDVNEGEGNAGTGGVGGGNHEPAEHNTPVGVASVERCGASCSADVADGRAALEAGDFAGALESYKCANTPEAAFGAGFARLMTALEGDGGDGLLQDFGLPPMQASVLLGPESVMSRIGERWNGEGEITLSGGLNLAAELRATHDRYDEEGEQQLEPISGAGSSPYVELSLNANATSGDARIGLDLYRSAPVTDLVAGVIAYTFDCTNGTRQGADEIPSVNLSVSRDGVEHYCSPPYSVDVATCDTDGGRVNVLSVGAQIGETASYQLENLLVQCDIETEDDTGVPGSSVLARLSGMVSATTVSNDLELSDLHPVFEDGWVGNVPASSTVTDALRHVEAIAGEMAEAACYFDIAGRGTGTVFTLPGALYGGSDAAVSAGDAQILSAASLLTLAAAQLGAAYEINMPLNAIVCDDGEEICTDDGCTTPNSTCVPEEQSVSLFNAAFAKVFHADTLAAAEGVMREGLERLSSGIDALGPDSVFARTPASETGLLQIKGLTDKALESLDAGEVVLPDIAPPVLLNLKALFDSPPDRSDIDEQPLLFASECDPNFPDECDSDTRMNTAFWSAFLADSIQADWESDHEWTGDDDALAEALRGSSRAGILIFE